MGSSVYDSYEIGGYLGWSLRSAGSFSPFFLSFVCHLMSPNRPQSVAEHAQTSARVGQPISRVGG